LVAPDVVLTAGHCMEDISCADVAFIFDYTAEPGRDPSVVSAASVYECAELLQSEKGAYP